jgi:hypothetical protein
VNYKCGFVSAVIKVPETKVSVTEPETSAAAFLIILALPASGFFYMP